MALGELWVQALLEDCLNNICLDVIFEVATMMFFVQYCFGLESSNMRENTYCSIVVFDLLS